MSQSQTYPTPYVADDDYHNCSSKLQAKSSRRLCTSSGSLSKADTDVNVAGIDSPIVITDSGSSFDQACRLKPIPSETTTTTIPSSPSMDTELFAPVSLNAMLGSPARNKNNELSLPVIKLRRRPTKRSGTPCAGHLQGEENSRTIPTLRTPSSKIFLPLLQETEHRSQESDSQKQQESKWKQLDQSLTIELQPTAQLLEPSRLFQPTTSNAGNRCVQDKQRKTKRVKSNSTPRSPPPLLVPSFDFAISSATRLGAITPPARSSSFVTTHSSSLITDADTLSPKKRKYDCKSGNLLTPLLAKPKAMRPSSVLSSQTQATTMNATSLMKSTFLGKDNPAATPCSLMAPIVNINGSTGCGTNSSSSLLSSMKHSAFSTSLVDVRVSSPLSPSSPFRRIILMKFNENDITMKETRISLK